MSRQRNAKQLPLTQAGHSGGQVEHSICWSKPITRRRPQQRLELGVVETANARIGLFARRPVDPLARVAHPPPAPLCEVKDGVQQAEVVAYRLGCTASVELLGYESIDVARCDPVERLRTKEGARCTRRKDS